MRPRPRTLSSIPARRRADQALTVLIEMHGLPS